MVVVVSVLVLVSLRGPGLSPWTGRFIICDLYATAYLALTLRVFATAPAGALGARVDRPQPTVGGWRGALGRDGSAFGFCVVLAVVALGAAAVLPQIDGLVAPRDATVTTVAVVVAVAVSWLLVAVCCAVEHARIDQREGGLEFPGGGERTFTDYLYVGISVTSTFGTTDVSITTSRLRRLVHVHAVLVFVFNTVIVALLVSALVRWARGAPGSAPTARGGRARRTGGRSWGSGWGHWSGPSAACSSSW